MAETQRGNGRVSVRAQPRAPSRQEKKMLAIARLAGQALQECCKNRTAEIDMLLCRSR
jgi:hypothetical protein